jgi:hypothetical protein
MFKSHESREAFSAAEIAPMSAELTATLIPAAPAEPKPTPPAIDCGTFDPASAPTAEMTEYLARLDKAHRAARAAIDAKKAASAPEPTLTQAQMDVIFAEIRAIEQTAVRSAITSADNTSLFRAELGVSIQSGDVRKEFLEALLNQIDAQAEAVNAAIAASNLVRRLAGDLAPTLLSAMEKEN